MDTMTLLPLDSPEDLVLRGFDQNGILARTGVDVGYHGSKVRSKLVGVDRVMYKVEHVRQRYSNDEVRRVLMEYRDGTSKGDVLARLGLHGENIIKLKVLFGELGMGEMFVEFDLTRRRNAMRDGVKSTYGVDNVFELPSVQDAAKNTRVEKYGAAYTFDHESSLSEKARRTAVSNMSDPEFKHAVIKKRQETLKSRYGCGVSSPSEIPEIAAKISSSLKKTYENNKSSRPHGDVSDQSKHHGSPSGNTLKSIGNLEMNLWIAMGFPSLRDQKDEYSWLPDRQVAATFEYPRLEYGQRRAIQAAKACNGGVFYRRELDLWSRNPQHPKGGTVQSRLYVNRFTYLGRTPSELTDVEILNGLGISGVVRRYTTFNADGMKRVIEDYGITSIYDPCAGWGERLFTCASLGVSYAGLDINSEVVAGHHEMIQHYGLTSQTTMVGDAAAYDMRDHDHDMVFTCPPYGDTEIYTNVGAENLDDDQFVEWWRDVVVMSVSSSTRVFAYQINQKWKNRLNDVLRDRGWRLDSQIEVGRERVGHFNRARSGKREFEEVQVFVRDVA